MQMPRDNILAGWPTRLAVLAMSLLACPSGPMAALARPPRASHPFDQPLSAATLRQQIEADWLRQAEALRTEPLTTQADARGACDGVKDGKYGFHTAQETNPWWQVDLGARTLIGRIVVYNRLDYAPGLHNADHLRILTSDDGRQWTLRHENSGQHFGGIKGARPLTVTFPEPPLQARYVRLLVVSAKPVFFHLDEVEIFGPTDFGRNLALHRPADQSSLSRWSTVKSLPGTSATLPYPTAQVIERGRRLGADLQKAGVDCEAHLRELAVAADCLRRLPAGAKMEDQRDLYLQARWAVRRLVFANPLLNFDQLLLVKRFTQETYPDVCLNHMPWVSRPGGDLCILSGLGRQNLFAALADPAAADTKPALNARHLLNQALGPGHVHGLDLSWDARRVVFGYARAQTAAPPDGWLDRSKSYQLRKTEEPTHIFEIGTDGRRLRQLTTGAWSDLDPAYAPNDDIVFISERCGTSLQCNEYDKDETSCNLYTMKPDGRGIRRLSVSKDGDYLPHTLDDGTIAYTRWEYHERSWAFIQSIWTVRPDGTGADAIFKQHFANPWALEDTRSIPGSARLVSIATGHHTLAVGPLVIINPRVGINDPQGIAIVTPGVKPPEGGMDGAAVQEGGVADSGGLYSTPWALSEKHFLVAYSYSDKMTDATGYGLYLVDVFGNKELLYRDPAISCFTPIPLRPRTRPPVVPDLTDQVLNHANCTVSDASFGSDGITREQVRYIRIAEPVGWPYDNQNGGQRYGEDHRYGGPGSELKNLLSWTPVRILGDVPVECDGSANFQVPADTAVYFQLLDENRMELRRMRSFISFQPGETRACVGCHESRGAAPVSRQVSVAANRPPSLPVPPPWGDRPVSFLRDVQPVLDGQCVSCHGGLKPAGGLDFSGGLLAADPVIPGYGHNRAYETIMGKELVNISRVRAQDAGITPPLAYGSRRSRLITALGTEAHVKKVNLSEADRLRLVMWIDANAPYHDRFVNKRAAEPVYDLAADQELRGKLTGIHAKRCGACHPSADISRLDWIDLHQPERSLFLRAPLAKSVGEPGRCEGAVYRDETDPDYVRLRLAVEAAVKKAWAAPRRDLQALVDEGSVARQRASR